MLALSNNVRTEIRNQVALQREEAMSLILNQKLLVWVSLVVGVVLVLGAILFSFRTIISPIKALRARMFEIADGDSDLTVTIPVRTQDELGELSEAFNRFMARLRGMISQVGQRGVQLKERAAELRSIADQSLATVQQQQQESERIAIAFDEINRTVQNISAGAEDALTRSEVAQSAGDDGQRLMHKNQQAVDQLIQQFSATTEVISTLAAKSREAGSILTVIQNVSDQTNLLALNAAIEAARAGENGRGFAVVADEVRELAQRTRSSAEEIQKLLGTLQNQAAVAVESISAGANQLELNTEVARETAVALDKITEEVAQVRSLNVNIAAATAEQSAVMRSTQDNLQRITQAAAETQRGASENVAQAEKVEADSSQIQQLLSQFRV